MRAGDAVNPGDLDRLCPGELWEDRRQPAGEHRLAGARGALEQETVSAGRGDLEREQRHLVPAHVAEIVPGTGVRDRRRRDSGRAR